MKSSCGYEYIKSKDLVLLHNDINSPLEASSMSSKSSIPKSWILLDSQSTINVFGNKALFMDIHESNITLRIRCIAGVKTTKFRGHLFGYG